MDRDIRPPPYVENQPFMNLDSLTNGGSGNDVDDERHKQPSTTDNTSLDNVNILDTWPKIHQSGMDVSQLAACKRMLTKTIAIVQGPPGTGKTFVSIAALRVMIDNWTSGDAP